TQVTAKAGIVMIGALARKFFGSANDRRVKGYQSRVNDINALEPELAALSDEALKARTAEFRQQLADGKTLDDILVPAFATVREEDDASDITYSTNTDYGFYYMRDNMKYRLEDMVQRGHFYAIVDEVDSILIVEARTPLIISGPLDDRSEFYNPIDTFFPQLDKSDYEVDEKQRTVTLTEAGMEKIETLLRDAGQLKGDSLYDVEN